MRGRRYGASAERKLGGKAEAMPHKTNSNQAEADCASSVSSTSRFRGVRE
jgi:hypothetical protein